MTDSGLTTRIDIVSEDLSTLTDAELRERLDDALLAQDEPVDDMTTDFEYRENLPNLIRALMDETHARAIAHDVERELADVDTDALPHLLQFAELAQESDARTVIALRVLRAEIDRRAAEAPRELTPLDRAAAIIEHARTHELHWSFSNISASSEAYAQLWTKEGTSSIAALRPWIASLGAETVEVRKHNGKYQITAAGCIGKRRDIPFTVTAITRDAETKALAKALKRYTLSLDEVPARLIEACERPIPRDHIPSADCWCDPTFNQSGQFFKHPTNDGLPAKFEPPIVPGAEQDADGYAREDHR
ncbi:hypothetical protein [Amycolatopsis sp. cmx-4-54]|uniref:hypothetical protein n=1 Tax=Amycolatopsis sp. cmx-4-54 TaxID=2790936 RepID=UPI00397C9928